MGARQTPGGEEPAHPATCAYQLPEWMENSLPKWMASDQTQTACWLPEWALIVWRLWLLQQHQPHRSPSASETILATRIPKTIWVSKEFLKCFKGSAIEVLIFQASGMGTGERKDDIFLACRMPLRWQHLSSSWRASRFLDKLLWEWHSRWVRLAFYLINHGEVTSFHSSHHPHSFTASIHLFYVAQGFQQNFSQRGIIQGNKWYSFLELDITMNY